MKLLFGQDESVAVWAFHQFKRIPTPYKMAIGILNNDEVLVGAALFQEYNGFNAELSYFGPRTLTAGIIKSLAIVAVDQLNLLRVTIRIPRRAKRLTRRVRKFGFAFEGVMPGFYGKTKGESAVVFGLYRDKLERLKR